VTRCVILMSYSKELKSLGLSEDLGPRLDAFTKLFARWNQSINLSAARTPDDLGEHVLDSLQIIPVIPEGSRIIDVGSGGGFPSVVVAIGRPDVNVVALEPVHKKHAFLRTAARALELVNFSAFARRVEDHGEHDFDVAMSRATFDLREWIERGLELVRVGGLVFGFEAVRRDDLPVHARRREYLLAGKQRAIVSVERLPALS